jgi:hypothetical protein
MCVCVRARVCVCVCVVHLCISYHWYELSYYNQFYRLPFSSIGECRAFVSSLALCSLPAFPHFLSSLLALMCFLIYIYVLFFLGLRVESLKCALKCLTDNA